MCNLLLCAPVCLLKLTQINHMNDKQTPMNTEINTEVYRVPSSGVFWENVFLFLCVCMAFVIVLGVCGCWRVIL